MFDTMPENLEKQYHISKINEYLKTYLYLYPIGYNIGFNKGNYTRKGVINDLIN